MAERARLAAMLEAQSDVVDASKRIAHVIEDMRVLSQPARLPTDSCDLSVAVAWAVRATAHEFLHRAMVKVENVAQGTWVKLDAGRIEQILINLLVNAAHAISPGHAQGNRVVLFMRREPGKVVLEISDTGAGMSPEVVARVFEPFFTTKELGHGTGLGLAICRGIVTAAGGDLEVESQLGKGSSFRLSLPEAAPQETPSEPSRAAAAQAGPCARILVIDDEPSILRLLPRLLPRHDVVCLAEARAALQLLEYDSNFDVILCDLMMPNMSGMQLYEALLALAPRLARRMVFMTGGVTTASTADFLRVVGNDCLTKPILRDELQSFIDRRLVEPPRA